MVSRVMWGASPKRKSYHGTQSQDGHTRHGNQQPYKDKLETTISFSNALEQAEPSQPPQ